ncbi:hypothetical protein [Ornithinimicrobium humiphilum]|uniref:hypothetical protein n=1 Tax=Ornithinimicrobium humiphilum TaxID=125288 RepID=UPI001151E387|nr:hypothetical protein [Ornithinimicrobium humiphilum]
MPIGLGSREEVRAWPRCWFREGQPWLHYPSRSNLRWLAASGLDIPPLGPDTGGTDPADLPDELVDAWATTIGPALAAAAPPDLADTRS